jgi:hypothetical protein
VTSIPSSSSSSPLTITQEGLGCRRRAVDGRHRPWARVTHDSKAASYADLVVVLGDTELVGRTQGSTAEPVLDRITSLGG